MLIQKLYSLPNKCFHVFRIYLCTKSAFALYSDSLVSVTEGDSVYCAVRTDSLSKMDYKLDVSLTVHCR